MGLGAGDPEGHGFERKYLSCDEQGSFRGLYGPDGGGEVALPESAPIGFDPPGTGHLHQGLFAHTSRVDRHEVRLGPESRR